MEISEIERAERHLAAITKAQSPETIATDDIINGLMHMGDDHPCCKPTLGAAIARLREMADIAELARKDAERLRSLQCSGIIDREDDMMPRVYVELIKRCRDVESPREAAESADEKPDGQAEND